MRTSGARPILRSALRRLAPARYIVWKGPTAGARVALTFDDGPHPEHTPVILGALREADARATFFVVGSQVERHPELVTRLLEAGHELGNHTYTHVNLRRVGWRRGLEELRRTDRLLRQIDPSFRGIYRPPWGEMGLGGALYGLRYGRKAVMWTLDSHDHCLKRPEPVRECLTGTPVPGGTILLFHDDNPFTAAALPEIIKDFRQRGLAFATVSEQLGD